MASLNCSSFYLERPKKFWSVFLQRCCLRVEEVSESPLNLHLRCSPLCSGGAAVPESRQSKTIAMLTPPTFFTPPLSPPPQPSSMKCKVANLIYIFLLCCWPFVHGERVGKPFLTAGGDTPALPCCVAPPWKLILTESLRCVAARGRQGTKEGGWMLFNTRDPNMNRIMLSCE